MLKRNINKKSKFSNLGYKFLSFSNLRYKVCFNGLQSNNQFSIWANNDEDEPRGESAIIYEFMYITMFKYFINIIEMWMLPGRQIKVRAVEVDKIKFFKNSVTVSQQVNNVEIDKKYKVEINRIKNRVDLDKRIKKRFETLKLDTKEGVTEAERAKCNDFLYAEKPRFVNNGMVIREEDDKILQLIYRLREEDRQREMVLHEEMQKYFWALPQEIPAVENKKNKPNKSNSGLTKVDYDVVMGSVNFKSKKLCASYRLALTILFLTGIRVSNLKTITVKELKDFFEGKTFTTKAKYEIEGVYITIPYLNDYNEYLQERKEDFSLVCKGMPMYAPVWNVSREHLTRDINRVLKDAGKILKKNLRSYSFVYK